MTETAQQYVQRVLGYVGDRDPLSILQETLSRLVPLVTSQPADRLTQRPAPDKWSAAEIMAHLADAEMVLSFRVRLMLGQNGVPIQGYDQNAWAAFSHYEQIPPAESLEQFTVLRHGNLRLLLSLSGEQLEHWGMHSERGRETVAHVIRMWAGHDLNHRAQVEKILQQS